jgi:pimeloyl-ACP methyl ester carboxylesterase
MTPIIYLPGASGTQSFWQPVADRLADLGPATRLGWPGFGDEAADPSVEALGDLVDWTVARLPKGKVDLVAQSMGGVLAILIALKYPERVRRLVLCATSGGVDVMGLGAADWRPDYSAELPAVPNWFVVDRTDVTRRLPSLTAPTLVLYGEKDPLCTPEVADFLAKQIPGAKLACIAGGDHIMARTKPAEVAAKIRDHLIG